MIGKVEVVVRWPLRFLPGIKFYEPNITTSVEGNSKRKTDGQRFKKHRPCLRFKK